MKKVILLFTASVLSVAGFAQKVSSKHAANTSVYSNGFYDHAASALGRTTGVGDTFLLENITSADTVTYYQVGSTTDSGFVTGTDAYGDKGYAERYDFNGADSSMKVLGVVATFGGVYNPSTTKTVTFNAWSMGAPVALSSTVYNSGLPNTSLASVSVSLKNLGIHTGSSTTDTSKEFMFTTPTAFLSSSFFVGYTINYDYTALAGDTIALYNSLEGERTTPGYFVSGGDTIINNQNVTEYSDGTWNDNFESNFGIYNDLAIYPIVVIGGPTSVNSVTKNNFTFFGNYPNPAVNSTNISFALATTADVTISISDINGRTINTIQQKGLSSGSHVVSVETSNMPAGDYLYVIRTSEGDGIASKLTVIK